MAHQYNQNFTDEDEENLIQNIQRAIQPCYHPCGWLMGGNDQVCNAFHQGHEFSEHLRTYHGVIGSDKTVLRCHWIGCSAEMKKESFMRHVHERHLELRHACPHCSERFTRSYTRDQHVTRRHSGSS